MRKKKLILTQRDKLIIDALEKQDFCLYKDIEQRFFSSRYAAYLRLNNLKKHSYIVIEYFNDLCIQKNLDSSALNFIGKNRKYICLNEKHKILRRKISRWKIYHQLLLFSVKERLENLLNTTATFENQVRDLKRTLYDRTFEPYPDFYLKGENFKLAVELELHTKSQNRYSLKMSEYGNSSFTHVLYVVANNKKTNRLIEAFRHKKYVATSHYINIEEVLSYRYGKLPLLEWLKKRTK